MVLNDASIMPFGKYGREGTSMVNVPADYLLWLFDKLKERELSLTEQEQAVYDYIEERYDIIKDEKITSQFLRKNKRQGFIVTTEKGYKGFTYHDEAQVMGKTRVYLVTDNMVPTGQRLLSDPKKLKVIGNIN